MKKLLFLASFKFKTGFDEHSEQRLILVDSTGVEDTDIANAYIKFNSWFPETYPESTLIHAIVHKTII